MEDREEGGRTDSWGRESEFTVVATGWDSWEKLKDKGIVGGASKAD